MRDPTTAAILSAVLSCRYQCVTEAELQAAIAMSLESAQIPFEREVSVGAGERIDFLCGTVGLEIKVQGALAAVLRQIHRYLESPSLTEIILVTTRAQHRRTPFKLRGKTVRIAYLPPF